MKTIKSKKRNDQPKGVENKRSRSAPHLCPSKMMIWSELTGDCKQSEKTVSVLRTDANNFDKNQLGVAGGMIFGIKKCIFNADDFSTIAISSYSPNPG